VGGGEEARTVGDPAAEVAGLLGIGEAVVEVLDQVADDGVHVRLELEHMADGEVLGDGPLHAGVLRRVERAEDMEGLFSVDDAGTVLVELGLVSMLLARRASQGYVDVFSPSPTCRPWCKWSSSALDSPGQAGLARYGRQGRICHGAF